MGGCSNQPSFSGKLRIVLIVLATAPVGHVECKSHDEESWVRVKGRALG